MLNIKGFLVVAATAASLSGCYVVPLQQYPSTVPVAQTVVIPVAPRPIYTARLYPVNEAAAALGRIAGTISNPERGHGEFVFVVGGEAFSGEATRATNAARGSANAAGNRGGYVRCDYTMSSAQSGTGTCNFSSGARFDMHISL